MPIDLDQLRQAARRRGTAAGASPQPPRPQLQPQSRPQPQPQPQPATPGPSASPFAQYAPALFFLAMVVLLGWFVVIQPVARWLGLTGPATPVQRSQPAPGLTAPLAPVYTTPPGRPARVAEPLRPAAPAAAPASPLQPPASTPPPVAPAAPGSTAPAPVAPPASTDSPPVAPPASADSAPVAPPVSADSPPATPPATVTTPSAIPALIRFVDTTIARNEADIRNVLSITEAGYDNYGIERLAITAGRVSGDAGGMPARDRRLARQLNDEALAIARREPEKAYALMEEALAADPLDVEIAGNLATYAIAAGHAETARLLALYALSLPRAADRAGRIADWVNLAAAYATLGEPQQAKQALFVTLAIARDTAARCTSAIYAVQQVYGDVLKEATEEMFARALDMGLAGEGEGELPRSW